MHSILKLCTGILVLGLVVPSESVSLNNTRIVGGVKTTIDQAPYIVQLLYGNSFSCGGSILTPYWILTAAHCVHGRDSVPARFTVRGGSTVLSGGGVVRSVEQIFMSPSYDPNTFTYDVALLKLSSPLTGTNIRSIQLCSVAPPPSATVKVSGWGLTSEGGSSSNQLKSVLLPIVSTDVCRSKYYPTPITSSMICAAQHGEDSCSGDSGGPMVYNNQLCGIVSWGKGCAQPAYPGVYTDVTRVTSFINTIMAYY